MADWYYAKNGQQQGPISPAELKKLVASGEIGPTDLVFQEGGTQWVEASSVKGLFPPAGTNKPAPTPAPEPQPTPSRKTDATTSRKAEPAPVSPNDEGELPEDDYPPQRSIKKSGGMGDFLAFRSFITPTVVMIMFWLSVLGVLVYAAAIGMFGIAVLTQPNGAVTGIFFILGAILIIPFGVLIVRIYWEVLILFFRIYETLKDIHKELERARHER
jgi:hypothetical protein